MKRFTLFLLLSLNTVAFAQKTSGYLGKRFFVAYDFGYFPAMQRVVGKSSSSFFNTRHVLGLHYTVGQHSTLGFETDLASSEFLFTDYSDISHDGKDYSVPDDCTLTGSVDSKVYSINFRWFLQGHLAPVGSYVTYRISFTDIDIAFNRTAIGEIAEQPVADFIGQNIQQFGIAWGFGENVVIWKNLMMNAELQCGINFPSSDLFKKIFDEYSSYNKPLSDYFSRIGTNRAMAQYLFNLKFGFSYLIF